MKSFTTPLVLIITAGLVFFFYSQPTYEDVQVIQAQTEEYQIALEQAQSLVDLRNELVTQRNAIPTTKLDRLYKMLPDNVDTVRLLIEIDQIANEHGMSVSGVEFNDQNRGNSSSTEKPYNSLDFSFSAAAEYEDFLALLSDLERNLRLLDVQSVQFGGDSRGSGGSVENDASVNQYQLQLRTYWMNQEDDSSEN